MSLVLFYSGTDLHLQPSISTLQMTMDHMAHTLMVLVLELHLDLLLERATTNLLMVQS